MAVEWPSPDRLLTHTPGTWLRISFGWVGRVSRRVCSLTMPTVAGVSLSSSPSRVPVTVISGSADSAGSAAQAAGAHRMPASASGMGFSFILPPLLLSQLASLCFFSQARRRCSLSTPTTVSR